MFRRDPPVQHPDETERLREQREKYRREARARPEAVTLVALNHVERDAARDVYQTMEAVQHGEQERRTGKRPECHGLNAGSVVDEIVHAINLSRVRRAEENNVNLCDGKGIFG